MCTGYQIQPTESNFLTLTAIRFELSIEICQENHITYKSHLN